MCFHFSNNEHGHGDKQNNDIFFSTKKHTHTISREPKPIDFPTKKKHLWILYTYTRTHAFFYKEINGCIIYFFLITLSNYNPIHFEVNFFAWIGLFFSWIKFIDYGTVDNSSTHVGVYVCACVCVLIRYIKRSNIRAYDSILSDLHIYFDEVEW